MFILNLLRCVFLNKSVLLKTPDFYFDFLLGVVACTAIKKIIPTEFENKNRDVQNPVKTEI